MYAEAMLGIKILQETIEKKTVSVGCTAGNWDVRLWRGEAAASARFAGS